MNFIFETWHFVVFVSVFAVVRSCGKPAIWVFKTDNSCWRSLEKHKSGCSTDGVQIPWEGCPFAYRISFTGKEGSNPPIQRHCHDMRILHVVVTFTGRFNDKTKILHDDTSIVSDRASITDFSTTCLALMANAVTTDITVGCSWCADSTFCSTGTLNTLHYPHRDDKHTSLVPPGRQTHFVSPAGTTNTYIPLATQGR